MVLMNLLEGQQWRKREQTYGHGGDGEEGVGEIYRECNMETDITICKTDKQWEFAIWFGTQTGAL